MEDLQQLMKKISVLLREGKIDQKDVALSALNLTGKRHLIEAVLTLEKFDNFLNDDKEDLGDHIDSIDQNKRYSVAVKRKGSPYREEDYYTYSEWLIVCVDRMERIGRYNYETKNWEILSLFGYKYKLENFSSVNYWYQHFPSLDLYMSVILSEPTISYKNFEIAPPGLDNDSIERIKDLVESDAKKIANEVYNEFMKSRKLRNQAKFLAEQRNWVTDGITTRLNETHNDISMKFSNKISKKRGRK